jgi:uncharacterized protein (TIGR03382 family)
MRSTALILASTSALALAGACTDAAPETVAAPIIGGTLAPDDDAVVMIASFPTDRSTLLTCSATLVAPDVLLTAAHCVDPATHPGHVFGAFLGADASSYDTLAELEPQLVAIRATHIHADYDTAPPFHADIGVALLTSPITDVTPIRYRRTPLAAADVGSPARIVGYGQAMLGVNSSTRRQAETVIAALDPGDTIAVGSAGRVTCLGDSGGPALFDGGDGEELVGVDSYADNGNCDQPAHFRRPDLYLPFIDEYTGYQPAMPDADPGSGGDDDGGDDTGGGGGGCSAGHDGGVGALVLLALVGLMTRRRR